MLYLWLAFAWFSFVMTGIGVIVATEPRWNRARVEAHTAWQRPCPRCPQAAPDALGLPTLRAA